MAGGTGGHVYPAMAVADGLEQQGFGISWLGTQNGIEARVVANTPYKFYPIEVKGARGYGFLRLVLMPFWLLKAFFQSLQVLRKVNPSVVIGLGGYVSGPGAMAAWVLRKPIIIHEQNAIPGFTNRIVTKFAACTLESFPNSFKSSKKLVFSGNPVRHTILNLPSPEVRFSQREGKTFRLLILGGSLGAQFINQLIPKTITKTMQQDGFEIWHQTGENHVMGVQTLYKEYGLNAKVDAFIEKMDEAYAWADLVIARAGATTIAELANVGIGSILIPFPFAVDDHQTMNAKILQNCDAAILIQQKEMTETKLRDILLGLQAHRARLIEMAVAAKTVAAPDALQKILEQCLGVCRETKN